MFDVFEMLAHSATAADMDRQFDAVYPGYFLAYATGTLTLIGCGVKRYSSHGLLHVARYHSTVKLGDMVGGYRINDHVGAYFARRFHASYPQHDGFFELRKPAFDRLYGLARVPGPKPSNRLPAVAKVTH
jgi:hypothetical protein